jgi:dihydrofolate synthase/folylpolyglutamate synthase
MNYDQAIEYIHSFPHGGGNKRSLDAARAFLARLGSPEKSLRFVHVAGTNGKGSTAAMIESAFRAAGYCTGLFTSPYVRRFNERIRVDGCDIGDEALAELTAELKPFAEAEAAPLSEFEFVTALGLVYFARRGCGIVILEAGLGGRNDYTNVIPAPDACVFTAIGLDHTKQLGDTVEKIAEEKAGIIKPGAAVVSLGNSEAAERVFAARCEKTGARYLRTDTSSLTVHARSAGSSVISFGGIGNIRLPLAGEFQPYNAANAITALRALADTGWLISDEAIRDGLERVRWSGRFETLCGSPRIILDGAHNPQAAAACVKSLLNAFPEGHIVFVIAMMADKDVDGVVTELLGASRDFVCVPAGYPRAMPEEKLRGLIRGRGARALTAPSVRDGVAMARQLAGRDGAVCCLGTLYFQNDVRAAAEGFGMRELFALEDGVLNYDGSWFVRPSVRAIVIRDGRLLTAVSSVKGYCKFPGGGIEPGETHAEALAREVREETGFEVLPGSIRPFGFVHRAQRGDCEDVFLQDNFYYTCSVGAEGERSLDGYEKADGFETAWLNPDEAIGINAAYSGEYGVMAEREKRVMELLRGSLL